MTLTDYVIQKVTHAKAAAQKLATLPTDVKNAALLAMADAIERREAELLKANQVDTMMGRLSFDGPNNHGPDLSGIRQAVDRTWLTVWPSEIAAPGVKPNLP